MKTLVLLILFTAPPRQDVPLPGVTITFEGRGSVVTDTKGEYTFVVPDCWSGKITPAKAGYKFDPPYVEAICLRMDASANFVASEVKGKRK